MRVVVFTLLASALLIGQTFTPTPEGDALFDKQDWPGAAREFKSATGRSPQDGRAWFRLASALHRMGEYREAAAAFGRASELNFQTPMAEAGAARAYAALRQPAQTLDWLSRAEKSGFTNIAFVDSDPHLSAFENRPEFVSIVDRIRRKSKPCLGSPEYHQFDFWVGEWDVVAGGQKAARSRIEKIADGCIIQENWMPFNGPEGKSWNFYNATSGKWEQHWMSAGSILALEGKIDGSAMRYSGTTLGPGGSATHERMTFAPLEDRKVHQVWEQSTDGGKTWAVVFDGVYIAHEGREQAISDADRKELLDHLKLSQNIFAEALRGVTPAQARFKPAPDRWSILECAEHLAQAEQLLLADAIDGLKLPTGRKSTVTKDQLLQAWGTAAQKAKSSGDYDPAGRWSDLATIQKVFDERRARTIRFAAETQDDLHGRICCGDLDIYQQVLGLSAHTLRHVKQMNDVKADPGYPKQGE